MCSMQLSVHVGGLGAYSLRKMLKCIPYESTSEAVGDHHKDIKCMATGL